MPHTDRQLDRRTWIPSRRSDLVDDNCSTQLSCRTHTMPHVHHSRKGSVLRETNTRAGSIVPVVLVYAILPINNPRGDTAILRPTRCDITTTRPLPTIRPPPYFLVREGRCSTSHVASDFIPRRKTFILVGLALAVSVSAVCSPQHRAESF
jgi:hypothetical protein